MGTPNALDEFMAAAAGPLVIVTLCVRGEQSGCVVGFSTQTSIHPLRFLVCLSRENHTTRLAPAAKRLAVHSVPAEAEPLARLFGGETGDEVDKFAQVAWSPGRGGVPLLADCPTRFVGRVVDRLDVGDHIGYLLAPEDGAAGPDGPVLEQEDLADLTAGHPA